MKRKILFTSILSAIIISYISVGSFAATNLETVSAYLNHGLNFKLSGKSWKPANEPITYDGSTYLPVRAVSEALGVDVGWDQDSQTVSLGEAYDATINFPADKFPQTAAHIASAIAAGKSNVCTIARSGADANRNQSLAGIATKDGYDRDEWPMAMCKEGGANASVGYVEASDNRGSGSWVGNALTQYPDSTRVKFVLTYGELNVDEPVKSPTTSTTTFASCAEAKSAGAAPLHKGDPGYSTKLDRDGDGVACE